jgi:hypothetical protein
MTIYDNDRTIITGNARLHAHATSIIDDIGGSADKMSDVILYFRAADRRFMVLHGVPIDE